MRIFHLWRICWQIIKNKKAYKRRSDFILTVLTASPKELIVRDHGSPWRELPGGVGEGGRASLLAWLQPFSFTKKSRTCSVRCRRWWGPLTGTPWRKPARRSGPGSRLSPPMTALSLNKLHSLYVPELIFFTLIKSDDFQLYCVIF